MRARQLFLSYRLLACLLCGAKVPHKDQGTRLDRPIEGEKKREEEQGTEIWETGDGRGKEESDEIAMRYDAAMGSTQRQLPNFEHSLVEVPDDVEDTETEVVVGKSAEETLGQVEIGVLAARGAGIGDGSNLGVAVLLVGDRQALAAVLRALASVAVLAVVESDNEGAVGVDGTAGTRDSVLGEPGSTTNIRKSMRAIERQE